MSKASIEAGRGHVSLSTDDSRLVQGLNSARQHLQSFGRNIAVIGASFLGAGAAIGAAMTPAIAIFATYEQALADLRAAANPTADQFARLREQIESVARATGESLPEVTAAYSELLKAGISLDAVLGGVGQTAVQFARVSGMQMAETAVILVDALNVFGREGITASQAVNIMNQAADASTISLREVSGAFASGGSTMALFNQSMRTTATAIAILGNSGIKAEDAGTVLKTLMLRIATGSESAGAALTELGVNVRGANGEILPMIDLIDRLGTALNSRSLADRDRLMSDLAGDRGIRGLAVLLREGTAGWQRIQEQMGTALTVEQKFTIMTETLLGSLKKLWVNIQLIAVAIGEALEPAFRFAGAALIPVLHLIGIMIQQNQEIVQWVAGVSAAFVVFGAALVATGIALSVAGYAAGVLATMLSFLSVKSALAAIFTGLHSAGLWALSIVTAVAGAATSAYTLQLLAAWIMESIATAGTYALVTALGAVVVALGAVVLAFGGFIAVGAGILAAAAALAYFEMKFEDVHQSLSFLDDAAEWFQELWDSVANSGIVQNVIGVFGDLWSMLEDGFNSVVQFMEDSGINAFLDDLLSVAIGIAAVGAVVIAVSVYLQYWAFQILKSGELLKWLYKVWEMIVAQFAMTTQFIAFAFRNTFEPLITIGQKARGVISEAMSGMVNTVVDAAVNIGNSFSRAWSVTATGFTTMARGLVSTATQAWGGIMDAFAVGDMATVWEIVKTTGMLAWAQLVQFIEPTFNVWKDTFLDTFNTIWDMLKILFQQGWAFLREGFFTVALAMLTQWDRVHESIMSVKDALNITMNQEDRDRAFNQREQERGRRNQSLRNSIQAARDERDTAIENIEQETADRDAQNALLRIARDEAATQGNQAEVDRLQGELDALTNGAWQERMMQEYLSENFGDLAGAAAQQLTPGGGAAAAREKLSSMGSFSAQASFGFLGATSRQVGPMERLVDIQRAALDSHNRANRELLEAQRQAHQLLRAIERAAGAVFA